MSIAHQQARHRPAELWCDGRFLCTIEEDIEGFWRLAPASRPRRESAIVERLPHRRGPSTRQQLKQGGGAPAPRKRLRLHLNFG